jgi:hypothetical protein
MATASVIVVSGGDGFPTLVFETKVIFRFYIILADNAAIGYLPDVMSVYRRNSAGLSYTDSNLIGHSCRTESKCMKT